jgi:hypothetical protein
MSDQIIDVTADSNDMPSSDGKSRAIIAHITLIGWIIALVQNNNENKSEFTSFYIRQMLGLLIWMFVSGLLTFILIGFVMYIAGIVFWSMSRLAAKSGEKTETPLVGKLVHDWFKGI